MTILFDGVLMADYHQIYLRDAVGPEWLPDVVTEEHVRQRMYLTPGAIVFMTARNFPVPVRVELHHAEPGPFIEAADHVVAGGLTTSGRIGIAGLTDYWPDAARVSVPGGDLRAIVVSRGLERLSADGVDGADRYEVHLWPGRADEVRVLKQWDGG